MTAEAGGVEASYTGKVALFYMCGMFSSGEQGGGEPTTVGCFCYCSSKGNAHELQLSYKEVVQNSACAVFVSAGP